MPELPEVETIAKNLREGNGTPPIIGQRIINFSTVWPRHVEYPCIQTFNKRIRNREVVDVTRRGKYLVFPLDQETLLVHLRMSGDLLLAPSQEPKGRFEHTIFNLDNGWDLRFSDARKFGRIGLYADPAVVLGRLGPEPLSPDFTQDQLANMLLSRRRLLKPLLLDQSFLAGLGNIYTDEALHQAGLHPMRISNTLSNSEIGRLWKSIRDTLKMGLHNNGASIDWVYRGGDFQYHFRVYKREGEPCFKCGTQIQRTVVGGRGTHFCPRCQSEDQL